MLKIKDDVDLKELEKFGFFLKTKSEIIKYVWKNRYYVDCIEIDLETRQIRCLGDKNANVVLYDLIQAGLVEKVKEE